MFTVTLDELVYASVLTRFVAVGALEVVITRMRTALVATPRTDDQLRRGKGKEGAENHRAEAFLPNASMALTCARFGGHDFPSFKPGLT